jgi:type IV pilus assembly protein PilB
MGIDSFLVASSLSGVVAQRLVRKVCPHCSIEAKPTKSELEVFEKNNVPVKPKIKRAVGCELCNNKGYKGRHAIFELLDVNESIVRLVSNDAKEYELLELARENGTKLLIEAGLEKVNEGITTLEEVMRISLD